MSAFKLGIDTVHVWRVALDRPAHLVDSRSLLSDDECIRADRFRFDHDRDRWTIAHGALRRILGSYLEQEPNAVRFRLGSYGKPEIDGSLLSPDLKFNLSHSGAYALIAVARSGPVGVDLERIQPEIAWEDYPTVFTSAEQELLVAAPDKAATFFQLWTRKEAFLKAVGTGIPSSLDQATPNTSDFTTYDLTFAEGYLGAVAVPSGVTNVIQFNDD